MLMISRDVCLRNFPGNRSVGEEAEGGLTRASDNVLVDYKKLGMPWYLLLRGWLSRVNDESPC